MKAVLSALILAAAWGPSMASAADQTSEKTQTLVIGNWRVTRNFELLDDALKCSISAVTPDEPHLEYMQEGAIEGLSLKLPQSAAGARYQLGDGPFKPTSTPSNPVLAALAGQGFLILPSSVIGKAARLTVTDDGQTYAYDLTGFDKAVAQAKALGCFS